MLPKLTYHKLLTQTFSTKPDSPDCVFLVLCRCKWRSTIIVNVYSHGDKVWKTREFDNFYCHGDGVWVTRQFDNVYSSKLYTTPVFIEGIFYIVFPVRKLLASYNIALGEFKVESRFVDNSVTDDVGLYEAFELNGELMLIGIFKENGFIQMFDRSTIAWAPVENLGDHSIFISNNSILLVPTIGKEGISNCPVLPNKIYCCSWRSRHGVYLFEGGKLVKFSGESIITKWYGVNVVNCQYWIAPADDLSKREEPGNSPKILGPQTMLPVVTEQQLSNLIDGLRLEEEVKN